MKMSPSDRAIDFRFERMLIEKRRDDRKKRRALRVAMRIINTQNRKVNALLRNSGS